MKHKCILAHTFIFGVFTGNMPPFEMYGSMYRTHTNLRFIRIYGFSAIFHFRSGYPSTSAWKPRHTWATFHNHISSIELPTTEQWHFPSNLMPNPVPIMLMIIKSTDSECSTETKSSEGESILKGVLMCLVAYWMCMENTDCPLFRIVSFSRDNMLICWLPMFAFKDQRGMRLK